MGILSAHRLGGVTLVLTKDVLYLLKLQQPL
jgi:hypothetical protein